MGLAAAPWIFEGVKDLFVLAGIYLAGKAVSENAPIIADGISSAMSSDGGIPSASSFPDAGSLTASNGDAYIDHDLDADEYAAWIAANEKAEDADAEQDVTCPSGTCTAEKNAEKEKEQEDRIKELEDESTLTDESKRTRNFDKKGTYEDAIEDFKSLDPKNVKEIETKWGKGYSGELENGGTVSVRPGSKGGDPTLQHTPSSLWPKIKWRYH